MLPAAPLRRGHAYWSAAPCTVPTRPPASDMAGTSPSLTSYATAPPDVAAAGEDATGLTQRELLMEVREDIRALRAAVDAIARDQALGVERRAAVMSRLKTLARPTGVGRAAATYDVPIEGRDEWLAAARRSA